MFLPRPAEAQNEIQCSPTLARIPLSQPPAQEPAQLPEEWATRCRPLPGVTIVHIPKTFRTATRKLRIYCLEAMIADAKDCHLEQGRSKLLLGPVPKNLHNKNDFEVRLNF